MLTLISPAKINLFLRVLKKRSDGYHELASLFQAIDLYDTLHFELADNDLLECEHPSLPTDSSNLIWKAVNLYRKKTGLKFAIKIKLEKHIPTEAGLGGGSSNAATALFAVNALQNALVPKDQLIQWASEIGSDVAFFLSSGTAFCSGRGECVQPVLPTWNETVWVAKGFAGLSTPLVYGALKNVEQNNLAPERLLSLFSTNSPIYCNDLEGAACSLMPELLKQKKKLLNLGFKSVFMAGSGSSFICVGEPSTGFIPTDIASFAKRCHPLYRSDDSWYTPYSKIKIPPLRNI